MKTIRCNRCGLTEELRENTYVNSKTVGLLVPEGWLCNVIRTPTNIQTIDLCPLCIKALKKWVAEGVTIKI